MKQKFSTHWISSKQPRKQRKFIANAPLHLKRNLLSVNLSKPLREKHKIRNAVVRKEDTVKVMRGKFKGTQGKILSVSIKRQLLEIEGVQTKKMDGSKVNVKIRPSNLQIIELTMTDKMRGKSLSKDKKPSKPKAESKPKTKTENKENKK